MHMLGILIFMTAAYQHNIARANGFCEPPTQADNTVPVYERHPVNARIRIQCAEGYMRKAGTSNLITCTEKNGNASWDSKLPLQCIRDPKKPHTETQTPPEKFISSTTERTEIMNPTVLGTSMPTTATGHITLTTTNEVVTSKTRRTTSQPTLKSTTKEAESFTTTNTITSTNSTSSTFKSRDYMTTTSSHTPSSLFTTITGISACMKTSTVSEENGKVEATFSDYTSTIGGVTSIIIICLVAAGFLVRWRWRLRRRETNGIPLYHTNPDDMTYVPVPVSASEHCSAEPNKAANKPTTDSDNDTNQPQTDPAHSADTCDKLLPQTDSC